MRRTLFLLILSAFFARGMAQGATLEASSLSPEIRKDLLKEDPHVFDREISSEKIDKLIKKLQQLPNVEQVSAYERNGKIAVETRMVRHLGQIRFLGLSALSESAAKTAWSLSRGDAFEMNTLVDAAERLRTAYKEAGVLNPSFDVETPESSPGTVDLTIKVTEGPLTSIGTWFVNSPDVELSRRLEKILNSKFTGPYTEAKIQAAQDFLRSDLKNGRHLRSDVGAPEVRFNANETKADIRLHLDHVETYSVSFHGNRDLASGRLEEDILDLKNFTSTNPNVSTELTEKIRQAYLVRGYARVEVSAEESEGGRPFARRLLFEITEGPQIRIDRIEVSGRFTRDQKFYDTFIRQHSSNLVKSGFYNKDDLEIGYKNLLLQLQNEGYLIAKISSTRTQYNRDRSKVVVHVNLDEGPLTLVESVQFEGNQSFTDIELRRLFDLTPGGPLKLDQIDAAAQALKKFYQSKGYMDMNLTNEKTDLVIYNSENTRAQLNFRIYEGPQVHVASILTDGNTFTKDEVILHGLDFSVGDLLTPTMIDESVSRLQRTGYFSNVEIKTLEDKTTVANRTVIVKVSERNPGVFNIGVGVTNDDNLTLRGFTGVAYRNLYGTGRGISLRVEGNYDVKLKYTQDKITAGYLEPNIFDTLNRGRVTITRSNVIIDYKLGQIQELNQSTFALERDFTKHITGTWNVWSYANYVTNFVDETILTPAQDKPDTVNAGLTGVKLDIDYRDNPFNPTKGNLTKFSIDYASPTLGNSNTDEFWRSEAGYTHYTSLGPSDLRLVWANHVRGGYLASISHGAANGVPFVDFGFALGSESTVRGYQWGTSEVFPNAAQLGSDNYRLLTAEEIGLVKSELRFPLWGDTLDGAIFYDGGIAHVDGLIFDAYYRDSVGFGIRYITPVGPLNIEYGWKLRRRAGEDTGALHLTIGSF